jgi:hypothetical protein
MRSRRDVVTYEVPEAAGSQGLGASGNPIEFMMRLGGQVLEINRMLGTKYVPAHACMDTPIGRDLVQMLEHHNAGRCDLRDFELLRLAMLVKNLKEIELSRPELLKHYKRELRHSSSSAGYYGVRFEVNIAASLARHGVSYSKTEAPDFSLNGSAGIECTSARLAVAKPGSDLLYKVKSCVTKKAGGDYVHSSVALLVDVTNLFFHLARPNGTAVRGTLLESIRDSDFGSIALFAYMINPELKRLESGYFREDSENISGGLKSVLDLAFPSGEHVVENPIWPREG